MKLQHIFILYCLIFGLLCPVSAKSLSSEKIVFSSNRDGNWEIYIMNPDGTRQERLTYDRAVDCEPVISPTGDRILFTSNRRGTRDLYLMDVDGRNVRPLFGIKVTRLTNDGSNYCGNWFAPGYLPVSPSPSLLSTLWGDVKIQN